MTLQNSRRRAFFIDGTALAYRSFFAFIRNPLINSKGVNTSGAYGFTSTLLKIIKDEKPDLLACVFDTSAPTFRHKMYSQYKATREKMPDELREQIPVIRDVVNALNVPIIELEGYEADDVLATLAKRAELENYDVYLVTIDKDLMQMVSGKIKMYAMGRGGSNGTEIYGPDEVKNKMGVGPERIVDLLSLTGDSSDNIPGIPGIGPKTALKLLEQFHSLNDILQRPEEIERQKLREKVESEKENALLSRKLVTLDMNVPITIPLESCRMDGIDAEKTLSLFKELEFSRFIMDIPQLASPEVKPDKPPRNYKTIIKTSELKLLTETLQTQAAFALDIETTSLSPIDAKITGLSFSFKAHEAFYVPVLAPAENAESDWLSLPYQEALSLTLEKLRPILEDEAVKKYGQNIKYDWIVLKRHGISLKGVDFDTMVAAYLVNPSARRFNLDALAMEYLKMEKIPIADLIGTGKNQITMDQVALSQTAEYACEDADAVFQLREILEPEVEKMNMLKLMKEVESPLIEVLSEIENHGVALDVPFLQKLSLDMAEQLDALTTQIYHLAGEEFNINSPQQLGSILFEKLKIHEEEGRRKPKRTKTGGYSTDVRVLESYSFHALPKILLDYRQLAKLKSTYADALPKLINRQTGRVHASFNQTVTATGRLSTSDPNLQNIPIRTEQGREIRRAFIAQKPGWLIGSADYSQIELRLMAHISKDEAMIASFNKEEDIHKRTASEILQIPLSEVTDEHRRQAKMINFGIIYGMGAYGLSSRLGIGLDEAQHFISAYFTRYPGIHEYMEKVISLAHKHGYVTTLLNRRRTLPELNSDNRNIRDFAERTAINTPIQGTAADLIKIAMIRIAERIRNESWKGMMILQIHDELLFEAPEDEIEDLMRMVRKEMEQAIELDVPIKVDTGIGKSWFEAH